MDNQPEKNPIEVEFQDFDKNGSWSLVYQEIREECLKFDYALSEAKKAKNKNLNRYRDVSPYDHTRIVLSKGSTDYINASLVKMEEAHRQYILTQGPLPNTTSHFWVMVWEQNCKAVLMLNKIVEKNQVKCHQYWPIGSKNGGEDLMDLSDVGLKVELISETEGPCFTTRVLRLTDSESSKNREILHFHYTMWPDFGVPQSPTVFLRFLNKVRGSGALDDNVGPPVVHCSAGIGRSGTFCLVDTCLVLIKKNGVESVKVRDVLLEMRKQRMGLIQTQDQLRFSYQAIIEGIKTDWDKINDNDPVLQGEVNANPAEEEEPPPLPPPRGESLKPGQSPPPPPGPLDSLPPLPSEPPHSSSSDESSPETSSPPSPNGTANSPDGVRKRKAEEQLASLAAKVSEMKRKQQNSESWNNFKRSILQPINLSIGALVVGGIFLIHFFVNRV